MPSDYLANRKTILVIAIMVIPACSILSGLATSFLMLLGAAASDGPGRGSGVADRTIDHGSGISEHRRGFNMGSSADFINSLLSNFAAPLIRSRSAWPTAAREAFYIAGIPGFIVAIRHHVHSRAGQQRGR